MFTTLTTTELSTSTSSDGKTILITKTRTETAPAVNPTGSHLTSNAAPSGSSNPDGSEVEGFNSTKDGGGLTGTTRVVVAVVIPIIAVALIAMILLFFFKKRKRDKADKEQRRKEIKDYGYNPNSPGHEAEEAAAAAASSRLGYRGWGSTAKSGGSGTRKASNMSSSAGSTMPLSPGNGSSPYSDNSIGYAHGSPTFSPDMVATNGGQGMRPASDELNAAPNMQGVNAAAFDADGVHRGISNASSNYSTVTRSDVSESGIPTGAQYDGTYYGAADGGAYDQYLGHPYQQPYQAQGAAAYTSPPVIRDVEARRNTRIETPTSSHFPQNANSGIAQNF